ncbi:MAG: hypothetical protein JRF37_03340 [Deltaproteobacteria bacterium]|nr:hypothetical protein [Deltaproteobacteria bacterium]
MKETKTIIVEAEEIFADEEIKTRIKKLNLFQRKLFYRKIEDFKDLERQVGALLNNDIHGIPALIHRALSAGFVCGTANRKSDGDVVELLSDVFLMAYDAMNAVLADQNERDNSTIH